jgi:DNA sulfur modification protein DndD
MSKVTIQSVAIENLGPFRERQVLDMTVRPGKPVVLIQALNGSGKTTLLTAIQLALYGQAAINVSRKSVYESFIESLRRKDVVGNPVVEVALLVETGSDGVNLTVRREWGKTNSQFAESCKVYRDNVLDLELTTNWTQFIEDILPAELAQLFLFDGEKIEGLANPQKLPDLLRRATEAFLGIGSIDGLINDLRAAERRTMLRSKEGGEAYEQLKSELPALEAKVAEIQSDLELFAQQNASVQNELDRAQVDLDRFTATSKRKGSGAFDAAAQLRANFASATERKQRSAAALAAALSHPLLPLAVAPDLLQACVEGVEQQSDTEIQVRLLKQIAARDRRVLAALDLKLTEKAYSTVAELLTEDRKKIALPKAFKPIFLNDPSMTNVQQQVVDAVKVANQCRTELRNSIAAMEAAERKMAEIPATEQLGGLLAAMQEKTHAVAACEERLKGIVQAIAERKGNLVNAEMRHNSIRSRLLTEFKDIGISEKTLEAAGRAKRVFEILKDRMLASKAAWLSRQITSEFQALVHKQGFVGSVVVNPVSYQVTLIDGGGMELSMERLSAGERQLLAIAVLSALIKERKSRFPVVVDTPLARLDRQHRETLVERFFSTVSHQVMVLSTDQEVSGSVYTTLHPYTSQEITLRFDAKTRSTAVAPLDRRAELKVAA